jgi:hypothetical protein
MPRYMEVKISARLGFDLERGRVITSFLHTMMG